MLFSDKIGLFIDENFKRSKQNEKCSFKNE